ncbi:conjugal transfer pilus assembly protein TraL [Thiohalospira halophila DSM 15071]|uniref:Conjugal transfer pilus assembly protein TraL n=1 Tax=Thiohalospira halophila DSM 15071 TaxID=1123397 RepID=A0A1I1N208_9GAMM|nr:type IV conjugative transfer system protein TraL [Thiohalospira halophila]SFC91445.1 conjugal transfer pilus assembly protein TraL [Thiohalospira halophila DSM 15071]
MSQDALRVPREVDDPPVMMMWSGEELGLFSVFFVIGFMLEQLLILCLIGALAVKYLRRYRNTRQEGAMIHQLWWLGFWPTKARSVGNPFERDHVG